MCGSVSVCVCVYVRISACSAPTLASLLLAGLAAAVAEAGDRLDVTLADGRRVQHQLRRAREADGQCCGAHQDPRDARQRRVHWAGAVQVLHWHRWHPARQTVMLPT